MPSAHLVGLLTELEAEEAKFSDPIEGLNDLAKLVRGTPAEPVVIAEIQRYVSALGIIQNAKIANNNLRDLDFPSMPHRVIDDAQLEIIRENLRTTSIGASLFQGHGEAVSGTFTFNPGEEPA